MRDERPGAAAARRATTRSPKRSRSPSDQPPARSFGAQPASTETTWAPAGASVGSSRLGTRTSSCGRSEVLEVDRLVGQLLDELERRGRLDGALVVVAADHGEFLGEKG
ncbi:MAG: sulfatase-like hydrolase/transferase, partial [Thermoanaerobaculia bacterium]